jgi:hypothetical protein
MFLIIVTVISRFNKGIKGYCTKTVDDCAILKMIMKMIGIISFAIFVPQPKKFLHNPHSFVVVAGGKLMQKSCLVTIFPHSHRKDKKM